MKFRLILAWGMLSILYSYSMQERLQIMMGEMHTYEAITNNNIAMVKKLLNGGVDPNAQPHKKDFTLLHLASSLNRYACVKALLKAGANVHCVENSSGHTPLHMATTKKCKKSLKKAMCKLQPPE